MRFTIVFAVLIATLYYVEARPQETDLDNNIIPYDTQSPIQEISSTSENIETSSSTIVTTQRPYISTSKPTTSSPTSDYMTRLFDDIIQIPIAALRAVNQLLNNISQRNNKTTPVPTTTTTTTTNQ